LNYISLYLPSALDRHLRLHRARGRALLIHFRSPRSLGIQAIFL